MKFAFFICSLLLCQCVSPGAENRSARTVFFFDLWKLDHWANLELLQGEPEWIKECDYRDPSFSDRGIYFPSVWKDEKTGKWQLIYSVKWSPFTMMMAESDDGISWKARANPNPSPDEPTNHLFTVPSGSGGAIYHDPQKTDGYGFRIFGKQSGAAVEERIMADPKHPWHELAKTDGTKRYFSEGITLVSKDGFDWEVKTGGHWNWQAKDWYPEPPVFAFWNHKSNQHVMAARPGWGDRRQCLLSSPDLKTWSDPELQFQPDPLDTEGPLGMYGMPVIPVGKGAGYVGLLWLFHNSSSEPVNSFNQFFGTMDASLAYSYDGVRFFRGQRKPFLKRNPIPEAGCTQIRPASIVETNTHVHIYSEGHRGAHGRERSEQRNTEESLGSLILHRLRKDGWMKLVSKGDWAELQTKPFALFSPSIRINAAANYGEIRFQLCNEKSEPIEHFTFEDCIPLQGKDSLAHEVRWKNNANLESVLNQALRLEIKFRQSEIYTLEMAHHFLDAHDMWLLKDGKPLPAKPRFDF